MVYLSLFAPFPSSSPLLSSPPPPPPLPLLSSLPPFLQVGDNQCLLQSLKDSPYFKGFADKATLWEGKLSTLDNLLQNLNQIQRKWVYLEPIFGRGALPREQGRFRRIDEEFR